MEINYDINYTKSFTRYSGTRNSIESLSHNGSISLFPIERLAITTKYNYTHQQITTSQYKNMALFDASVQYKMKPVTIKLELNNLLNTRHYAYTVFDTVNTYSYDYNLCGRTIMLTLLINK
jgi:outer membrane receptor protein involved in Fe transport